MKWKVSEEGIDETTRKFSNLRDALNGTDEELKTHIKTRREERSVAREIINEGKHERDLYLARHQNIRRLSEGFSLLSRTMHIAVTAQNAFNIAQLVANQRTSHLLDASINLREAKRNLELAKQRGASDREIADLTEDLNAAQVKLKEVNDQASQDRIGNIINLATTFAFLGTSVGALLTKTPAFIALLRRLGGAFGGGGGSSFSPGGGTFPSGFGGSGSAGGISGASPMIGGRCMSLCQETTTRLGRDIATPVATQIGDKLKSLLPVLLPVAAGTGVALGLPLIAERLDAAKEAITGWLDKIMYNLTYGTAVLVMNWPSWFLSNPFDKPITVTIPDTVNVKIVELPGGGKGFEVGLNESLGLSEGTGHNLGSGVGIDSSEAIGITIATAIATAIANGGRIALDVISKGIAGKLPNIEVAGGIFDPHFFDDWAKPMALIPQAFAEKGTESAVDFKVNMDTFNANLATSGDTMTNGVLDTASLFTTTSMDALNGYNSSLASAMSVALNKFGKTADEIAASMLSRFRKDAQKIVDSGVSRLRSAASSGGSDRLVRVNAPAGMLDTTFTQPTLIKVGEAGSERVRVSPASQRGGGDGEVHYHTHIHADKGILAEREVISIVRKDRLLQQSKRR